MINIENLQPKEKYELFGYGIYNGHKIIKEEPLTIETTAPALKATVEGTKAQKAKLGITIDTDEKGCVASECGFISHKYFSIKNPKTGSKNVVDVESDEILMRSYFTPYAIINGKEIVGSQLIVDFKLDAEIVTETSATGILIWLVNNDDYIPEDKDILTTLTNQNRTLTGEHASFYGLNPETTYSFNISVNVPTKNGDFRKITVIPNTSVSTTELKMEAKPANAISKSCAIIMAETKNIDSEEMGCGFEWRRYDAPDEMPSNFSPCMVSENILAGKLNNLSTLTYYKFRPYYKSNDGQIFYSNEGKWTAFITADADVYFEPMIYTYQPTGINENGATLRGYVLEGSDNIIEQGFEYWPTSNSINNSKAYAPGDTNNVDRVQSSGQLMQFYITGLTAGTEYGYRTYVKTATTEHFGSIQNFKTKASSGIQEINDDACYEDKTIIGYYSLQGTRFNKPINGYNIVLFSDGSTRKILIK